MGHIGDDSASATLTRPGAASERLLSSGLAFRRELTGCTGPQLDEISSHFSAPLPLAYRQILAEAGTAAGRFMRGEGIFFPQLLKAASIARDLVAEDGVPGVLSPTTIVFWQHEGYEFWYLDAQPGIDDPPVYYYIETVPKPRRAHDSFSAFFHSMVDEMVGLEHVTNPAALSYRRRVLDPPLARLLLAHPFPARRKWLSASPSSGGETPSPPAARRTPAFPPRSSRHAGPCNPPRRYPATNKPLQSPA